MPDDISGTINIDVLMSTAGGAEGVGAPDVGIPGGADTRKTTKTMSKGIGGMAKAMGKFAGLAGLLGIVLKALHGSVIFSTAFKVLTDILSAAVDMLLMPLIPILIPLLQMLWPLVEILTKNFRAWATPLGKLIGMLLTVLMPFLNFAVELLDLIYKPLDAILGLFVKFVQPFIEYAIDFWSNVLGKFLEFLRPVMEAISSFMGRIFEWIIGRMFDALDFIGKALGFMWDIQKKVWSFIGGVLKSAMDNAGKAISAIRSFIEKIFNVVKDVVGKVANVGKNVAGAVGDGIKKVWPGNWKLWQTGTDYVPTTGPAIVHKGERIIPAAENAKIMRGELGNVLVNAPVSVAAHTMIDLDQIGSRISDGIVRRLSVDLRKVSFG